MQMLKLRLRWELLKFRYNHLKWHFIAVGVVIGSGISVLGYLYPHNPYLVMIPIIIGFGYMEWRLGKFNKAHKAELEVMCAKHGAKLGKSWLELISEDAKDEEASE